MEIRPPEKSVLNALWKILVIDDDEDDYIILRDMLQEAKGRKFEIHWASTYEAGQKELAGEPYDAVLVDYDLGVRKGIELIREASNQGHASPLILFTGRGGYEVDLEAMKAGATLYITKDEANPLLLERVIRYAIELKQKETLLRVSEEKYRNLFENMAEEVHFWQIVRDEAGNIQTWRLVDANPPSLKTWGRRSVAIIQGKTTDEIFGPGAAEHFMSVVEKIMREGVPYSYEDYFPNLDKYFRFTSVPFGEYFITTGADITIAKQAEQAMSIANEQLQEQAEELEMQTEELQAQTEKLVEANRKLFYQASLLDNISEAAISTDASYNILSWNQAAETMYGWRADEVLGKSSSLFLQTEYLDGTNTADVIRQLREHGFWKGEVTQQRKDGTRFYVAASISNQKDIAGKMTGVITINRDITEQRRAEQVIQESESRLREMLESTHDSYFALDREWRFTYANRKFGELMSVNPQNVIGKNLWELFPQYLGTDVEPNLRKVMEERLPVHFQHGEIYTKSMYDMSLYPTQEGLVVFGMDRTDELLSQKRLVEEHARLQSVINNIPDEVWFVDASGKLMLVNDQVLKEFGPGILGGQEAGRDTLEVAASSEVYRPDGTVRPPDEAPPLRALRGEYVHGQEEIVRTPASGELRYRQVNAAPVYGADDVIIGSVSVVRDITEIRKLEKERVEAMTQITVQRMLMEQREKDRNVIARDLHDGPIQTLSSSLFQLQMVKEAFPDSSLQTELDLVGQDIKNTIHELRDLLNELRPPALIHFGLTKVIRMFLEDFKTRFPEIEVEANLTEEDQRLSNDAHLTLFRIFQAGMNNIVRHSEASKVWVVFNLDTDCYMLTLRDNGKGFNLKPDYSHLTRTGHFGLVGMKERSEVIGGEFSVTSGPGNGTTISVKVPLSGKNSRLI